jgi:hypothetical protein
MSTAFWTMTDANTGVPLYAATALKLAPTRANANVIWANSNTAQAFSAAVWGVDTEEAANTQVTPAAGKMAHSGWVQKTSGMGPVLSISANAGSYGTNSFVTFSGGGTGSTPANATVAVAQNGQILSVTLNSGGLYLSLPTATPVSGNAAFTLTVGGRAGRAQYETLVATGSITGNGAVIV